MILWWLDSFMDALLNDFRHNLRKLLNDASGISDAGIVAAEKISARLHDGGVDIRKPISKNQNPLAKTLESHVQESASINANCLALLSSLHALSDYLPWYKRPNANAKEFEQGHANAEILGPKGLDVRDDILVGVTLMNPDLTYPDHHHPPEEVYVVLSEGLWRQENDPWWSPGVGGYVYNPPDILHAMKSQETPLCAIWCLNLTNAEHDFSLAT